MCGVLAGNFLSFNCKENVFSLYLCALLIENWALAKCTIHADVQKSTDMTEYRTQNTENGFQNTEYREYLIPRDHSSCKHLTEMPIVNSGATKCERFDLHNSTRLIRSKQGSCPDWTLSNVFHL